MANPRFPFGGDLSAAAPTRGEVSVFEELNWAWDPVVGRDPLYAWNEEKYRRFMERLARAAAEKKRRQEAHVAFLMSPICVHCTHCGRVMEVTRAKADKIRRCPRCLAEGRRSGQKKFCRYCGKSQTRADFLADPRSGGMKGWAFWCKHRDC